MLTLAQFLAAPPVPMLPDAPFLTHYLLESPWAVIGGLVVAGIAAFITLNRQAKARNATRALLAAFALAAVVLILSLAITTDREHLAALTRDLVSNTAKANASAIEPLLADRVSVTCVLPLPIALPTDKATLLESVRRVLGEQYPIAEHTLGRVQATIDGQNTARTQLRVWARASKEQAMYDVPIGSWWRIDWRKDGEAWHVTNITLMQLDGLGGGNKP